MGIANIYEFLLDWHQSPGSDCLNAQIADGDAAAAVAQAAATGSCPICVETMEVFFRLYGRESGNLALKHMALGGVYLGGGIAPKNLDSLSSSQFLDGFFDKGRMEPLMRRMPVRVILSDEAPLLGAARFMAAR
jgi:glucokinase